MNIIKYISAIAVLLVIGSSCKKDDENDVAPTPPRDQTEQEAADHTLIVDFLKTHFYYQEDIDLNGDAVAEYRATKFDTIAGDNSAMPAVFDSELLNTVKDTIGGVVYTYYILKLNEGEGANKPTFADSTLVTYRGELFYSIDTGEEEEVEEEVEEDDRVFDIAKTPVWFDLPNLIPGFRKSVSMLDFKESATNTVNTDGTVSFSGFGDLVIFMPSGLGYFSRPRAGIPAYSPLIFNVQLYKVNEADHDRDGIPSYLEDLNGDRFNENDNTDGDFFPEYNDPDDDNDGTPTRDEITVKDINEDGKISLDEITFYDDDMDGIKNHLDSDDRNVKN